MVSWINVVAVERGKETDPVCIVVEPIRLGRQVNYEGGKGMMNFS